MMALALLWLSTLQFHIPLLHIMGVNALNSHFHNLLGFISFKDYAAYTWMFRAVLFIIAKKEKQPECPSMGEW